MNLRPLTDGEKATIREAKKRARARLSAMRQNLEYVDCPWMAAGMGEQGWWDAEMEHLQYVRGMPVWVRRDGVRLLLDYEVLRKLLVGAVSVEITAKPALRAKRPGGFVELWGISEDYREALKGAELPEVEI
jgi:hypothetical protein